MENLSDAEIKHMESEVRARMSEINPAYQHYGSVENLNDAEIKSMESEVSARRTEINPAYQHYGSVENLSDAEIKSMEAQIVYKKMQDAPYGEYLNSVIYDPNIFNIEQFEQATIQSIRSNQLMKNFTSKLVEEISSVIYKFKNIEQADLESIKTLKLRIEYLFNVYVKYLYKLKECNYDFNNFCIERINEDILESLWQVQKRFNIIFNLLIPKNLGKYGQAFERKGKLIPAITLIYDDLKNKEVNWFQILIFEENELTSYQKYIQKNEEAENCNLNEPTSKR